VSVALSEIQGPGGGSPWAGAVVLVILICVVLVWVLRRCRRTEEWA
jgi:uncharacterized membrane protein